MDSLSLAVLGAGSVRCSAPVIASLATYFGERPLDIRLYDADEERLDLFDRLARTAFKANKNGHMIRAGIDASEALEEVDRVLLTIDDNCAKLEAKAAGAVVLLSPQERISATLERLLDGVDEDAAVMSLQHSDVAVPRACYYRLDWPADLDEEERMAMPHQVLRWIRGDDYMFEFFAAGERSPLKPWLDDVTCATFVSSPESDFRF